MSEESRPRPFPEARPPHLPDILTRQSPWVVVFLTVAIIQIWVAWRTWSELYQSTASDPFWALLVPLIPSVATTLLGVALFVRHPNARKTMPLLAFGLGLLALGGLLSTFSEGIRTLLIAIAPTRGPGFPMDYPFESPAETAFRVFMSLLTTFALLYTAAGLSSARRQPRGRAERPLAIWLIALAVVAQVISVAVLAQIPFDATTGFIVQGVIGMLLNALATLAWVYLVTVVVGGWIAGEAPRRAWGLAAPATTILFAYPLLITALAALPLADRGLSMLQFFGYANLVAWVLLLAAFALGFPAPPKAAATPEDPTDDPPGATRPGSAGG